MRETVSERQGITKSSMVNNLQTLLNGTFAGLEEQGA